MGDKGSRITITGDKRFNEILDRAAAQADNVLMSAIDSAFSEMGELLKLKYNAIPKKHYDTGTNAALSHFTQIPAHIDEQRQLTAKVGFTNKAPQALFFEVGTPFIEPQHYIEATRNEYGEKLDEKITNEMMKLLEGE